MAAWPYKRCPECGLYHDVSVLTCRCGADLSTNPGVLLEEAPPASLRGTIDETIPVFQQLCPRCSTVFYLSDPARKLKKCYACNKGSIGTKPVLPFEPKQKAPAKAGTPQETPDAGPNEWRRKLDTVETLTAQPAAAPEGKPEEEPNWDDFLGKTVSVLRAEAVNRGSFSAQLRSDQPDLPLMLGRDSAWAEHLQCDAFVGNKHCAIGFRDSGWYVRDNHSANGTAVSTDGIIAHRQYLPIDGEAPLHDGDLLIFGHFDASPAFRISITEQSE